jgi:outer membrane receptor protein involved in Fe transport
LTLDPAGIDAGAYVAGRFRLLSALTVEVGVRRDRQTLTGETETSPRVNLACALGEGSLLRFGWGRFQQPQQINELQIEDGVLDFFPAQRAEHWEIDFDHLFASGLKLGASAYVKDMTRLRPRYENLFNPIQLFPESEPDRVRIAPERALARGIEIALGMDRGRSLSWQASYALASAEDRVDGAWVPRSWDQRHALNLVLNYRRGDKWDVSLGGVYHTGWPTTGVGAEQVQNPDGSTTILPIVGPRNATRHPAYHRLDLKVTRRFDLGGGTLGLYLDVTNLYGHDNVCCADGFQFSPRVDGSVHVNRTNGYWLRQLPVVGLTWSF